MKLFDATLLALQLMKEHGLNDGSNLAGHGWRFAFDTAKRRFGCAHMHDRLITLSEHLVLLNDEAHVKNTILHEIAHALCPASEWHGSEWKKVARSIGCTGDRCYSPDVIKPKAKYLSHCPTCKKIRPVHRRGTKSCGYCSEGVFNRQHLLTYTENI